MKTIKPFQLSCLARVFEVGGRPRLSLTALLGFAFDGRPLAEVDIWRLVGDELGPNAIFEEALPKPVGEVLVHGSAFATGGAPTKACEVRVELGAVAKKLYVVGDRYWRGESPSEPEPFTEMAVSWANAFGGPGDAANPMGKGRAPIAGAAGPVHWLPNVEDPANLVLTPRDRPTPAGFAPLAQDSAERAKHLGTYDRAWRETRYPGLPDDFDPRHWCTAPADQRLTAGFHRGDERFAVTGMHPTERRLEGTLPALRARLFVARTADGAAPLTEVETRLDTVHLFPRRACGVVVYRGVLDIDEDDGSDVGALLGAVERLGEPRAIEHYRAIFKKRLDKDEGVTAILEDADLSPTGLGVDELVGADRDGFARMTTSPGHRQRRFERRAMAEQEKARAAVDRARADAAKQSPGAAARVPHVEFPPISPTEKPRIDQLAVMRDKLREDAERQRVELEAKRAEAMARARKEAESRGVDFDAQLKAAEDAQRGPPKFKAATELAKMRAQVKLFRDQGQDVSRAEAELEDPRLWKGLVEAEAHVRETYRRTVNHQLPAFRLEGDAALVSRASVAAAIASKESLALRDLTGADLRGLALDGMDLTGAHLESADLRGATLVGANLTGAVLARADLSDADLSKANLATANLGEAKLRGTKFSRADLTSAILVKTDLGGASFIEAKLAGADFMGAKFDGADLSRANLRGINLIKEDLRGLRADGADLSGANLVECNLDGVSLEGARLDRTVLVECSAERLKLAGADLTRLCVAKASSLAGSDLSRAILRDANLRDTKLVGCDFSHGELDSADLSGSDCSDARFYRATAKNARFVRANLARADLTSVNLLLAILSNAKLDGTIFKGANLFRADLWRAKGDDKTTFAHANVQQARFRGEAGGLGAPSGTRGT